MKASLKSIGYTGIRIGMECLSDRIRGVGESLTQSILKWSIWVGCQGRIVNMKRLRH